MEFMTHEKKYETLKTLIAITVSFIIAFLVQLVVHEFGHYISGVLVGAKGGQVILHPFYNSKVVFSSTPGMTAEIIIGISGIVLDLVLATTIGVLLWKKRNVKWLPLLMWGAIAYIGEGIGMLSSLAVYPQFIEDITQLFRIGVPSYLIVVVSIVFVIIGLVWMILVIQMSGVAEKESFLKRLFAYLCSLPLYFALSMLFIKLFNPQDIDILSVRMMQMQISIILALLMTFFHKPIISILKKLALSKNVGTFKWTDVIFLTITSIIIVSSMLGYSKFFNS